jgi:hypothetical protein
MKAKIVMLPTDNSKLFTRDGVLEYIDDGGCNIGLDLPIWQPYHLYLIYPNVGIKVDDWCIRFEDNKIFQSEHPYSGNLHKGLIAKIIATTNRDLRSLFEGQEVLEEPYSLSEQSIKLLVDYYNQNNKLPDEFEVETWWETNNQFADIEHIKLNSQGDVDITIPEEKMYSKEEVKQLISKSVKDVSFEVTPREDMKIWLDKTIEWIKQNIK